MEMVFENVWERWQNKSKFFVSNKLNDLLWHEFVAVQVVFQKSNSWNSLQTSVHLNYPKWCTKFFNKGSWNASFPAFPYDVPRKLAVISVLVKLLDQHFSQTFNFSFRVSIFLLSECKLVWFMCSCCPHLQSSVTANLTTAQV